MQKLRRARWSRHGTGRVGDGGVSRLWQLLGAAARVAPGSAGLILHVLVREAPSPRLVRGQDVPLA